jgi:hypothetical protein
LSQPYKICPICDSPNHRNAAVCSTCGATLTSVREISPDDDSEPRRMDYDQLHGETDLLEGNLRWKGGTYFVGGLVTLAVLVCVGSFLFLSSRVLNNVLPNNPAAPGQPTASPIATLGGQVLNTNTPLPTIFLATVTQGPPTSSPSPSPTVTPTEGPCMQEVQAGDDLISIMYRCGHRDLEPIMSTVVALNDLSDPTRIQQGQTIEVPWPTPTIDPNAVPTPEPTSEVGAEVEGVSVADLSDGEVANAAQAVVETLQPGVTWHTVVKDENILVIAVRYGANLRVLSELNPEVMFSQCDFGLDSGGPSCTVFLYEGQRLRVPAPTPTPTIQPTASGSETPTPTATATFNAPSALSPSNRAFFGKDDLVTLRWVATGALSTGQAYLVRVEDITTGQSYSATTQDLSFIVPEDWHGQDATRHDYTWTVSVIDTDNPDNPYFTTESRLFTWQGRGS